MSQKIRKGAVTMRRGVLALGLVASLSSVAWLLQTPSGSNWVAPPAYAASVPQVRNTPTMSINREFNLDGGPGLPSSQASSAGSSFNIGQTSGPSMPGNAFNLQTTIPTNYVPPGGGKSTSTGIHLGGGGTPAPVRVCADGFVDADGRPIVGASVGQQYLWAGNTFIPDYAAYAGTMVTNTLTVPPNLTTTTVPVSENDTFNWVTTSNALQSNWSAEPATSGNPDTFWASIQINTNQTIAYLQAGQMGNCGQLLNACLSDTSSTAVDPNTISTDITKIGGPDCVSYYAACQVSQLIQQSGNSVMTSQANPQGTTRGGCQVFPSMPTCSQILPLFQKYAPLFSCSCDTTNANTPNCLVYCTNVLTAWQVDMGPTATCTCPGGSSGVGAPSCTQNCLGQLPGAQSAKGNGYTCGCAPNSGASAPVCQQNCGGLLPTFQAQYPNYTCTCPSGTAIVTNPVCVPTCAALAQSQQAADGPNYTCSCQNPQSSTEQPSCPMNCGGMMATNTAYQTNANQICSCASGNNSVTTPSCVPTCGSQLAATTCPAGSTAQCPSGNGNPGTPQCVQQTCGSLQATWSCPSNQVATCPLSTALSNPVCQPTCGSQLAGTTCSAGAVAFCAQGNSNPGTPTCQQQTCGTLQTTWSCPSGQIATCPSGTSASSNPVCQATCGSQLAGTTCSVGQVATCTAGNNSTTAPTCVQQACGTLQPTWSCTAPATAQCPSGSTALSNPVCSSPTCGSYPSTYCPAGSFQKCPSGSTAQSPPTCVTPMSCANSVSCGAGQVGYCPRSGGNESCVTVVTTGYTGSSSYFQQVGLIGSSRVACSVAQRGQMVTVNSVCGTYQAMCGLTGINNTPIYTWLPYLPNLSSTSFPNPMTSCLLGFTSQNYYIGIGDVFTNGIAADGANCSYFEGSYSGQTVTQLMANDPGCP